MMKNKFTLLAVLTFGFAAVGERSVHSETNAYAYPVPFISSLGHTGITFTLLPVQGTIKIYTSAGEMVREIGFNSPIDGKLVWDVKNAAGEDLGSDVYVYLISSGDNKKYGKLMVIR